MTNELDEYLRSTFKLRKILGQVIPKEATDYILELIVKDTLHRDYLSITEENESDSSIQDK